MEQSQTNFNIAFQLYDVSNSRPKVLTEMEGFLEWNVVSFSRDGIYVPDTEPVDFHICTNEDWRYNLYPPKESELAIFEMMKPTFLCVNDFSMLKLKGDGYSDSLTGLSIQLRRC